MSSGWTEVVITTVAGLAATEAFDVAPWVARRIVPVAARLWTSDRDQAAIYAEEWCDILDERPGKLFKLLTSLGFLAGAVGRCQLRMVAKAWGRLTRRTARRVPWSVLNVSARRRRAAAGLAVVGMFVVFFGIGMASVPVVALGIATGAFVPGFMVISGGHRPLPAVPAIAEVLRATPGRAGVPGRAELLLLVSAEGTSETSQVVLRLCDPDVQARELPRPGTRVPIMIPNGNLRRTQVLWGALAACDGPQQNLEQ